MASEPVDPKRFRVSSQIRQQNAVGTRTKVRLDVGVEHVETGIRGGDYVEGYFTDKQLDVKKAELAQQIARDLDAVAQGSETVGTRYVVDRRK